MFQQVLDPVSGSLALSALCGVLPLLVLFLLMGGLKMKSWQAGLIALVVALVIAIVPFNMPTGQALRAASEGAVYGFFPILWIVLNAIWIYNLTVASGHFDVLRRTFAKVSPDQRIQAIVIAFCFGALLEALAGFGTPVAVCTVMLMTVGFKPLKAAALALIANTAPVAFGAIAAPITALQVAASGASSDPRLSVDTLGSMVGRQTPVLAIFVPLILVFVVDGKRGLGSTWIPALACGVAFGVAQFVSSNYISVPLADIIASLFSALVVIALLRVWAPREVVDGESPETGPVDSSGSGAPAGARGPGGSAIATTARVATSPPALQDAPAEVTRAFAPYVVIIVIFAVTSLNAVKERLAEAPWTKIFAWPGLHVLNPAGNPVSTTNFTFNWLPAAGTLLVISGIISVAILRLSPATAIRTYAKTYASLWHAIVTVMAVLALAYVMNLSGQTVSLGAWLAGAGGAFAILSPLLGWFGVAVSGSDTASNALFGGLQVQTAKQAGIDQLLMAAANSSGGVLGKMISPQNLAIAASAVGMAGQEGVIFRKVFGWSLVMVLFMCVLVWLQSTSVLGWMVPG